VKSFFFSSELLLKLKNHFVQTTNKTQTRVKSFILTGTYAGPHFLASKRYIAPGAFFKDIVYQKRNKTSFFF
jgi:hypothetical protein